MFTHTHTRTSDHISTAIRKPARTPARSHRMYSRTQDRTHTETQVAMPVPTPRFPAMPSPIPPNSGGRRAGMVVGEEVAMRVSGREWWGVELGIEMARRTWVRRERWWATKG